MHTAWSKFEFANKVWINTLPHQIWLKFEFNQIVYLTAGPYVSDPVAEYNKWGVVSWISGDKVETNPQEKMFKTQIWMRAEECRASNSNLPPPIFSSTKFPLYPCSGNNNPPTILIIEGWFGNLCSPNYIPPSQDSPFPQNQANLEPYPPSPYWIFFTSGLLQTVGASPPASFTRYVLHHLSCPPPTRSIKPLSWSTRYNLLRQLTRPACKICFINTTGKAVLLQQRPRHIGPTPPTVHRTGSSPPKTVSTAPNLFHRRPRPMHRIYFTDDRVHRTGSASPTPSCTSPKMASWSRRTPHPRRSRRSVIGTLARFLAVMFFIAGCYLYVGILHREFLGCVLVSAFAFDISSSFYRHTPRIVMSCVCVPGSWLFGWA
jgi:hypothetical protein